MKYEKFKIDDSNFLLIEDLLPNDLVDQIDEYVHRPWHQWNRYDNLLDIYPQWSKPGSILPGDSISLKSNKHIKLNQMAEQLLDHLSTFFENELNKTLTKDMLFNSGRDIERLHRYFPEYYDNAQGDLFWHTDASTTILYIPSTYHDNGTVFVRNQDIHSEHITLPHKRGMILIFSGDVLHAPCQTSPLDDDRVVLTLQYRFPIHSLIE
ncbi:hypothetical protein VPHD479_0260 [Vibrio phage D479]